MCFLCVSCLNFSIIPRSFRPPLSVPYTIIGHNPIPVIMCHTFAPPLTPNLYDGVVFVVAVFIIDVIINPYHKLWSKSCHQQLSYGSCCFYCCFCCICCYFCYRVCQCFCCCCCFSSQQPCFQVWSTVNSYFLFYILYAKCCASMLYMLYCMLYAVNCDCTLYAIKNDSRLHLDSLLACL